MSYCIKCGHKNDPSSRFCTHCGNPQSAGVGSLHPQPGSSTSYNQNQQPFTRTTSTANDFDLAKWFSKNKVIVFSLIGIISVYWLVNYFFLKPHPDKDGKMVAAAECGCEEKRVNEFVSKRKAFLSDFNTFQFRSAYEARQKLDSDDTNVQQAYNDCLEQARKLHSEKAEPYAEDYTSLEVFSQAYYTEKQMCNVEMEQIDKTNEEIQQKLMNFSTVRRPTPGTTPSAAADEPSTLSPESNSITTLDDSSGILTDGLIRSLIRNLYNDENNIGASVEDINKLMEYYQFPLEQYYAAKNVDAERLLKIYSDSYFKSLTFHQVRDFENRMTISRQTDSTVKVIVGCTFEFSTVQSPGEKRSRNVFNVYWLTKAGKIKSVYQLL